MTQIMKSIQRTGKNTSIAHTINTNRSINIIKQPIPISIKIFLILYIKYFVS